MGSESLFGGGETESRTCPGGFVFRLFFFLSKKYSTVIIKVKNTRVHTSAGTTTSAVTMLLLPVQRIAS